MKSKRRTQQKLNNTRILISLLVLVVLLIGGGIVWQANKQTLFQTPVVENTVVHISTPDDTGQPVTLVPNEATSVQEADPEPENIVVGPEKTNPNITEGQPNRLINEKSPYLLQHAYNPVDWYPWGEEAFEKAHQENKPIFLSIGYSTCHWCHVMEDESFEDPEVARLMNETFVSIKVDREERLCT